MDTLTNFSEYYKTISNTELLRIVQRPEDYQPAAVAAARQELADRQLTEEQLAIAQQPMQAEEATTQKRRVQVEDGSRWCFFASTVWQVVYGFGHL